MTPSQNIRSLRRDVLGLTQAEFADRLGVKHPQSISDWERGTSEPSMQNKRRIARLAKKPVADIFGRAA